MIPKESQEQAMFVRVARLILAQKGIPVICLYAIPNGGTRHKLEAVSLKRQGTTPGIPDLFLSVARKGYHGLYIEMKRQDGGKVSMAQKEAIKAFREQGYMVKVCEGYKKAMKIFEDYLE